MKWASPIVALSCSITALLLTLWILVPAQLTVLWLVAVVAGEWSLYFGLLALAGIVLGMFLNHKQRTRAGTLAVGTGLMSLVFVAYPLVTSWPLMQSQEQPPSFKRYFFGAPSLAQDVVSKTYSYKEVEGDSIQLDVYRAQETPVDVYRPAVVVVHGGSWNGGTRSDFPRWNEWLVANGFVVFDIDYRLDPQPNWQTATEDVHDALLWIKSRADTFGVNGEKIALLGRSAGGHLALLAAYTAETGEAYQDAKVQAVVAFYAPTDLKWGYANPANPRVIDGRATLRHFTGGTPNYIPEVYTQASPINHVRAKSPATLLIHGKQDQLVRSEHANRLFAALQQVSETPDSHRTLFIPYGQHGFDYNFNGWGAQMTQPVLLNHLNKALVD